MARLGHARSPLRITTFMEEQAPSKLLQRTLGGVIQSSAESHVCFMVPRMFHGSGTIAYFLDKLDFTTLVSPSSLLQSVHSVSKALTLNRALSCLDGAR